VRVATHLSVENEKAIKPKLAAAAEEMLRDGFLDGLTRLLEGLFPGVREVFYEDAVAESVKKLLEAGERREIANPRGYITAIAKNEMRHLLRKAAREQLPQLSEDDEGDDWATGEETENGNPTEDVVVGESVFRYVKAIVKRWNSRNLKATTILVLESAYLGEALSSEELAERLSEILTEAVVAATARQWKKRGLDRLSQQLAAEDYPIHD